MADLKLTPAQAKAPLACLDCGLLYSDPGWVDASIPDDAWAEISGGRPCVLCLTCMTRRAAAKGMMLVPVALFDAEAVWVSVQDVRPFNPGRRWLAGHPNG